MYLSSLRFITGIIFLHILNNKIIILKLLYKIENIISYSTTILTT